MHIWFNLCRRYFLFHALNVSCVISSSATLQCLILKFLDMKYCSFVNVSIPVYRITHILNLPIVCMKMMLSSRPTHPVPFTSKCQICQKIDVYNFRYKISVGILMKLFFLTHKCINKKVHKLVHKQIYYIA